MSLANDLSPTSPVASGDRPAHEGVSRDPDKPPWPSGRTWSIILAAGMLAGLCAFGIGEVTPSLFPRSNDFAPEIRAQPFLRALEMQKRIMLFNDQAAAAVYGGLGLLLGLALGAAGGLARRSNRAAIAAGFTGMVLGGTAGAATPYLVLPPYNAARIATTDDDKNIDLGLSMRTHLAIWSAIGASAGFALGLGLGGGAPVVRATVGGILGAGLATVIHEFGGALVFPLAETFRPLAVTSSRAAHWITSSSRSVWRPGPSGPSSICDSAVPLASGRLSRARNFRDRMSRRPATGSRHRPCGRPSRPVAPPLLGEPSVEGFSLGRVQLLQSRKLLEGALEVILVEVALDQEHACESQPRIEAKRFAGLMKRPAPVLTLKVEVCQPLVEPSGPGIEGDRLSGGCQGGLSLSQFNRVHHELVKRLLVRWCRLQHGMVDLSRFLESANVRAVPGPSCRGRRGRPATLPMLGPGGPVLDSRATRFAA